MKIVLIEDWVPVIDKYGNKTGDFELCIVDAFDYDTGKKVIIDMNSTPVSLGAKFDQELGEWVLEQ